jgi:hypothetical protein
MNPDIVGRGNPQPRNDHAVEYLTLVAARKELDAKIGQLTNERDNTQLRISALYEHLKKLVGSNIQQKLLIVRDWSVLVQWSSNEVTVTVFNDQGEVVR